MTGEEDAPAEMPGEREIASAIYQARNGKGCVHWSRLPHSHQEPYLSDARTVRALFAPILAEKERKAMRRWTAALSQAQDWRNVAEKAEARALAAEAALAAERERIAASLDAQADALWERCETKRSEPPSIDEQADAAQAFALQKAAAAIRAEGPG